MRKTVEIRADTAARNAGKHVVMMMLAEVFLGGACNVTIIVLGFLI